jgi:sec-independent protein translocase protein TatC
MTRPAHSQPLRPSQKVPFVEHLYELRKRLFYIVASVGIFGTVAYMFEHHIINALLRPAREQEFIYTSPGGGLDFLFRVCLYAGIACSIPVIVYQLLRYIEPLIKHTTKRMVLWGSLVSGALALVGIVFGYFVGLPSGLDFLLHQFKTDQIQPLITIQSYMNFVMLYLLGSAMLLQIPLILIFINRIKPLQPKKLLSLSAQRWVILGAFIGSAVINASPQIMAQLVIAGPIILSYQIGVGIIWYVNKRHAAPDQLQSLRDRDAELRSARLQTAQSARPLRTAAPQPKQQTAAAATQPAYKRVTPLQQSLQSSPAASAQKTQRPARAANSFAPRNRYQFSPAQRLVQ